MSLKSNPKLIHNLLIVLNVNVLNVRPVSVTRETRRGRRPYFVSHPFFMRWLASPDRDVGVRSRHSIGPTVPTMGTLSSGRRPLRPHRALLSSVAVVSPTSHTVLAQRSKPMVTTTRKRGNRVGVDIPCVPVLWWPPVPGLLSTESQWGPDWRPESQTTLSLALRIAYTGATLPSITCWLSVHPIAPSIPQSLSGETTRTRGMWTDVHPSHRSLRSASVAHFGCTDVYQSSNEWHSSPIPHK